MGNVRFTLLGPPEVRHADQLLLFSTRKEFALLIYLAVEGHIHLRKNLSELFWPESDAMHGRAALRITLLHLRHLLGEDAGVDPALHLLATLPVSEIEHLYIHLGRAYELNAEWEKARTAYISMLAYAREEGELAMDSAALYRLAILVAQRSFDLATAGMLPEGHSRLAKRAVNQ